MMLKNSESLHKLKFEYKESSLNIRSDKESALTKAVPTIKMHRKRLEKYIQKNPEFLTSLKPIPIHHGPRITQMMAKASNRANVGPMAAVAGALADIVVEAMVSEGARVAIVENGGEASIMSDRPINVALSAGDSIFSKRLGFRLDDFPMGVATSSGLYSHAFSYGEAEAVTIFAENAGVADAAATATCNIVKGEDKQGSITKGVEKALSIQGVRGVLIIYGDMVGLGGVLPLFIGVNSKESISRVPYMLLSTGG